MGTIIENINALSKIKYDLKNVLVNNGQRGGEVFSEYPEQFRDLFRVLEDYVDHTNMGYSPQALDVQSIVPTPEMYYDENIVFIHCDMQQATIKYWIVTESGKNNQGETTLKGNTIMVTEACTVYCYALYRGEPSATAELFVPYYPEIVPDDPVITREGTTVTITCATTTATIYYKLNEGGEYQIYTGPITVPRTVDVYSFAQDYRGRSYEVKDEAPEKPVKPATPVLTFSNNTITITCETIGATIYYMKEGGYWYEYTGPITITSADNGYYYTKSIKDYIESDISDRVWCEYSEEPVVIVPADPVISCSNNVVTITCSTSGATIYYSTDNGVTYNEYTGTITISADTTFYAYSELNGETSNTVSYEAQYEDTPQPVAPADPVISCTNNVVTITCSTPGAVIWYSTDGGNTYNIYTEPITISVDTTFYAYSTKDGLISNVVGPYEAEYEGTDYSILPLTFEILSNGKVGWKCDASGGKKTIQYRKNNGNWYNMTSTTGGVNINVSANDIIQFRGSNSTYYNDDYDHYSYFTSTCDFNVSGNIMSLLNHNFSELTILSSNYTFNHLFDTCTHLLSASNLILPAATLTRGCYESMFYRCENLITPPKLPATTLAINCYTLMFKNCYSLQTAPALPATTLEYECYSGMFNGCTSLTTAPALPATTLASKCYLSMFCGCTSLVNAPILSATTLADGCYSGMFENCTSLITAPSLPATTLATGCYRLMFCGCTSLVNAPVLPATNLTDSCYNGMFYGCTSLITPPELPATTLANSCYGNMFYNCTSLTTAPELPATTLTDYCYQHMFYGCTSLTTAPELPATTLAQYCYFYMFAGCSSLTYIKCLATNISATNCIYNWVNGVAVTGTFIKKTGVTWPTGTSGIPTNWTVQEASS